MPALAEECIALLERVVEAATEGSVGIEIQPPYRNLSFAIAGRIDFEVETRQQILELTSEKGRLEKVKELLLGCSRGLSASSRRARRPRRTGTFAVTGGRARRRRTRTASAGAVCGPPFRGLGSFFSSGGRFFSTSSAGAP